MRWDASTSHIEPIARLLNALQLNKSHAHLLVSDDGVKFRTSSPSRTFDAQLFLDRGLFATYHFIHEPNESDMQLTLSLNALVHCLQAFIEWSPAEDHSTGATECFIDYTPGTPFRVSFAYDTMNSNCDLTVYDNAGNDVNQEIEFGAEEVVLQVIMSASVFAGVLRDLDAVSASEVAFSVNLNPAQLEVRATGDLASTEFVLPNEPNVLDALAAETNESFSYHFQSLLKCKEAVRVAKRVSLRFDTSSVLSIQCLCEIDDRSSYIEFRFLSKV